MYLGFLYSIRLVEYLGSYSDSGLDSNTRQVQVFKIKQKPVNLKSTYVGMLLTSLLIVSISQIFLP